MNQFIFKKKAALLIAALLFFATINAQPIYKRGKGYNRNYSSGQYLSPNFSGTSLQSLHCFGGSGNEGGFSNFMTQTNDGGFISCSYSNSTDGNVTGNHGGYDVWLIRFDASGTIQWKKSYGGSGDDFANRAIQTKDGGYLFLGYTTSNDGDVSGNHGEGDLWVVKLNASGNIAWQKTYGGSGDEFAYYGIIETLDGGYAAIGSSASHDGDASGNHGGYDILILKLSAQGVVQWTKTYGGSEDEYGNLIVQNNDGTYNISADSYSNNGNISGNHGKGTLDTWIARLNSNGNIVWKKSLGGSDDEFNASLITTHDGCILVGDYAGSHDGDVSGNHGVVPDGGDMWLAKINGSGSIIWTKTLGGGNGNSPIDFPDDEVALFLSEKSSGELLIAGGATSSDGDLTVNRGGDDAWLLRLDPTGNILWQKSFGGSGEDAATAIFQINSGGYTVAGWSSSNDFDFKHSDQHGGSDLFFATVSADNTSFPITQLYMEPLNTITNELTFTNFPNPFSTSTNISFFLPKQTKVSIKIYDLTGRLIRTLVDQKIQQGSHTFKWNTIDQSGNVTPAGFYFLRMEAANYLETRKILIIK